MHTKVNQVLFKLQGFLWQFNDHKLSLFKNHKQERNWRVKLHKVFFFIIIIFAIKIIEQDL